MKALEEYNGLNGAVMTREQIRSLLVQAEDEKAYNVSEKLTGVLLDHPTNEDFKITVDTEVKNVSLNAPQHTGIAKKALTACGRLKPGFKYLKGGKLIAITKKTKKLKPEGSQQKTNSKPAKNSALKNRLLKMKEDLNLSLNGDTPEITICSLNGSYLADGHEMLTYCEVLELYGDDFNIGLNASAKDVEAIVTEKILEKIKTGEKLPPWKKTWANNAPIPAQNFTTKTPYSGSNATILNVLLGSVMPTPYYLTFNQIKELGGSLKKNTKAIPLVFYKFTHTLKNFSESPTEESKLLKKIAGRKIKRKKGDITISKKNYAGLRLSEKQIEFFNLDRSEYFSKGSLYFFGVFNIASTTGIKYTLPENKPKTNAEKIQIAENIIASFKDKPKILEDNKKAYYKPAEDELYIPNINEFDNSEEYYSTLFHELIHATAHKSRLDRFENNKGKKKDASYAFEELIAELGGSYLCGLAGILEATHLNQASYLKDWYEKLEKIAGENPNFFVYATREAQKAVNYIIKYYDPDAVPKPKNNDKIKAKARARARARARVLKLKS